jgi:hypothetical protein
MKRPQEFSRTLANFLMVAASTNFASGASGGLAFIHFGASTGVGSEIALDLPTGTSGLRYSEAGKIACGVTLEQKFRSLKEKWRSETGHRSSISDISSHPSYREIVAMGEAAIPMILQTLSIEPDHWFTALWEITSANPINEDVAGDIDGMKDAWLAWGRANGYS